ncbi:tyrosine-type recombinase/integrase [Rubripirellula obstinata]|nr:site-specific integrase [Rubripirellula obstinata]
MATVFQKKVTRAMPADAERFTKKGVAFVRYRVKGKSRTAKVTIGKDGSERIEVKTGTFLAKYRDARGLVCEVPTGCRDEQAARSVLADLVRREELIRGNVITREEAAIADHRSTLLTDHLADYVMSLQSAGRTADYTTGTKNKINRLVDECGFVLLQDVRREPLERWLVDRQKENMAARTRNSYLQAIRGLLNWCIEVERLASNPLARVAKADEKSDRRKTRRAMTEAELGRLLRVARDRPLADYGRQTVATEKTEGKRAHWTYAPLTLETLEECCDRARERLQKNPTFIATLERRGRERMLVYKTMVLTGLRCNELRSITQAQLILDDGPPAIDLAAKDEKNRDGSMIPLRADLADDLRSWIADEECRDQSGDVLKLPATKGTDANRSVFYVADGLVKILDLDLETAGIPKIDNRGRSLDVHALRTTFGTLMSCAGVTPRTAQAAMRHSRIDLTMNVYTDPRLLDVSGAVDALPTLIPTEATTATLRATGTHDHRTGSVQPSPRTVAPTVAPEFDKACQNVSQAGNLGALRRVPEIRSKHEKTPENTMFSEVWRSDADGTRTRNLRIDSRPVGNA